MPLNSFVALTSKMAGDMNFCTLRLEKISMDKRPLKIICVSFILFLFTYHRIIFVQKATSKIPAPDHTDRC